MQKAPGHLQPAVAASIAVWHDMIARRDLSALPNELYAALYVQHAAPFRPEAAEVIAALRATGATVAIVSNASTGKIEGRLAELGVSGLPVIGGARKFGVRPATASGPLRPRKSVVCVHR